MLTKRFVGTPKPIKNIHCHGLRTKQSLVDIVVTRTAWHRAWILL